MSYIIFKHARFFFSKIKVLEYVVKERAGFGVSGKQKNTGSRFFKRVHPIALSLRHHIASRSAIPQHAAAEHQEEKLEILKPGSILPENFRHAIFFPDRRWEKKFTVPRMLFQSPILDVPPAFPEFMSLSADPLAYAMQRSLLRGWYRTPFHPADGQVCRPKYPSSLSVPMPDCIGFFARVKAT